MRKFSLLLLVISVPSFGRVNYSKVCEGFLEDQARTIRPILPDRRSAQEVVRAIDKVTREFRQIHKNYETKSVLAAPEGDLNAPIVLQPEGAVQVLDNISSHLRFAREIERGEYIPPDSTAFHPRNGWIIEETLWLASKFPDNREQINVKNVKFSSTLFPSKEFPEILGKAGAFGSLLKREIEVLRYHPSVVAYVPAAVFSKSLVPVSENVPNFTVAVEDEKYLEEHSREVFWNKLMPIYQDAFSEKALQKLLLQIKQEVDQAVGSETSWTLSARTLGEYPFPELTELIVKIDHPNIETAWLASLEFLDRYATALKTRVPSLREPAVDAALFRGFPALEPTGK